MKERTPKELIIKSAEQDYAKVLKTLGDSRFLLQLCDGNEKIGVLRGAMRKRVWINVGDYVLISLRDFQENKVDVIHKYSNEDVRKLRKLKAIEEVKNEDVEDNEQEIDVQFDDETL